MVRGPQAGLRALQAAEPALGQTHRIAAVRAHLLELSGDVPAARAQYLEAARTTLNLPERGYLEARAARLSAG
jgi:predicted RNA polymerase sigma factor